jgi:hypothetical protein
MPAIIRAGAAPDGSIALSGRVPALRPGGLPSIFVAECEQVFPFAFAGRPASIPLDWRAMLIAAQSQRR